MDLDEILTIAESIINTVTDTTSTVIRNKAIARLIRSSVSELLTTLAVSAEMEHAKVIDEWAKTLNSANHSLTLRGFDLKIQYAGLAMLRETSIIAYEKYRRSSNLLWVHQASNPAALVALPLLQ